MFQSISTIAAPVSFSVQINPLYWTKIFLNSHNQDNYRQEKEKQGFYLELDQK